MKRVLAAAVAALGLSLSSGLVLADAIIRDPNWTTAGHTLAAIGSAPGTYESYLGPERYLDQNNPQKFPNNVSGPYSGPNQNFALYTDVAANTTRTYNATQYKSTLAGGTTTVSQARYVGWFLNEQGATRRDLFSYGSSYTQSVSGNTVVTTFNGLGAGLWAGTATVTTTVQDVGVGKAVVTSTLRLDRAYKSYFSYDDSTIGAADRAPRAFSVAVGVDLDPGSASVSPGGGSPQPDQSGTTMAADSYFDITAGTNARRVTYTATDGTLGYHIGYGADSFGIGQTSSSTSRIGSDLVSAGFNGTGGLYQSGLTLNETVPTTAGDYMSGFLWNRTLGAVPNPGDTSSQTFVTSFSINTLPITVVPEPTAMGLLAPAAMLLGRRRR
jgi:hypothetical protein